MIGDAAIGSYSAPSARFHETVLSTRDVDVFLAELVNLAYRFTAAFTIGRRGDGVLGPASSLLEEPATEYTCSLQNGLDVL